ncbi:NAD(P)/FAD-dependent oxidoreductase [Acidisphaera sp. S103]|uniref:NAD(P)/FAD-dependent oxidoreductase n=1 Tax=Acidisphaera sp. S103 TaxID=1747223 RepID=UPI00131DD03F|nr:FAD-dependent monooxygenase [Acidisphaera sp. S103]
MRRDPLIIGAGPAGSAAAITLAQAGYRPVLVERTTGPADKVCGDFLSDDAIQRVRGLGVDPVALGASSIQRVRLIHGEGIAEATLPFPAFGLSRRGLDAALLSRAESAGAIVQRGQTVRHLTLDLGEWTAQTGDQSGFTAETVFLATGKHDVRNLPRARSDRGAVGMKMYFHLAPGPAKTLDGAIELTLFPGGYAGLQLVENGRAVLCIAILRQAFQRYGGGWPGLIASIEQRSRRFAAMVAGARPLLARPLAVAGIPYGYQAGPEDSGGLFRLGDQAAVIPSLTGDGMAIALHSGQSAAETWMAGGDSVAYQRALGSTLRTQMRLAGLLHHACMSGLVQAGLTRGARVFPGLLRYAASGTRLPPTVALPEEMVRIPAG